MNQKSDAVTKKKVDEEKFVAFVSKDDMNMINDAARANTPGGPPVTFAMPPPPGSQNQGFQPAQAVSVPL